MALLLVTTLEDEAFDGTESADAPDGVGLSLREALGIANDNPDSLDTITFDVGLSGGTLTLTQGQLVITGDTILDGDLNDDDVPDVTIDGTDAFSDFSVLQIDGRFPSTAAGLTIEVNGLVVTSGYGSKLEAFGYDQSVNVQVSNSIFQGLSGDFTAAVELRKGVRASFDTVTVTGNGDGRGLYSYGFAAAPNTFEAINSTFSNNEVGLKTRNTYTVIKDSEIIDNERYGFANGTGVSGDNSQSRIYESTVLRNGQSGAVSFEGDLSIYNSTISQNAGGPGGGLSANTNSNIFVWNSLISENEGEVGGGVFVGTNSTAEVIGGVIESNSATDGGGVYVGIGGQATIDSATISGNTSTDDGAGIATAGELVIENGEVIGNLAESGGGGIALLGDESSARIVRTIIADNVAQTSSGGGIANIGGQLSITESTLRGNAADPDKGGGGGVQTGSGSTEIHNTVISENAANEGGGVGVSSAGVTLVSSSEIANNTANSGGGGLSNRGDLIVSASSIRGNSASDGGGVWSNEQSTRTSVFDAIVRENSATARGGGVFSGPNSSAEFVLGAIDSNVAQRGGGLYIDGDIDLVGATITRNTISGFGQGGGLYIRDGEANVFYSTIANNTATDGGGGIWAFVNADVNATFSTISGNSAGQPGSGLNYGAGGGIFSGGQITLNSSTVSDNTSVDRGGGIAELGDGNISLTNTTVSGNSTSGFGRGGGIYGDGTIQNSTIVDNSTTGSGSDGGGIAGTFTISNSIVLDNEAEQSASDEIAGDSTFQDSNIVGDELVIDGALARSGIQRADVFNNGLANNGLPVPTLSLKQSLSNPALDAGNDASAPATDARGVRRTDFPGIENNADNISDLGAFELDEFGSILIVTTLADEAFDGTETAGASDGAGLSLREALGIANADPDSLDTITFDVGLSGGTLTLTQGQLLVAGDTTIDGDLNDDGTPDITIDANGLSGILRIENTPLEESGGRIVPFGETSTTVLTGLTLTGGYASGGFNSLGDPGDGSAIETEVAFFYAGDVTLRDSVVTGNTTAPSRDVTSATISADFTQLKLYGTSIVDNIGTGVAGADYFTDFTLRDSTVSNNTGDGISIFGYSASARIYDSTISNNGGTGVDVNSDNSAKIENTLISGNQDSGVSVGFFSNIFIDRSTISENYSALRGGGITSLDVGPGQNAYSSIEITNSTISRNSVAPIPGLDLANVGAALQSSNFAGTGGGIFIGYSQDFRIEDTAIEENSAPLGGGIFDLGGLTIEQSMVSENEASFVGGGIVVSQGFEYTGAFGGSASLSNTLINDNAASGIGGGIANIGGLADLTNVTITRNEAADAGGIAFDPGDTEPTRFSPGSSTLLANTIIGDNTATDPGGAEDFNGPLTLEGGNILSATRFVGSTPVESGFSPSLIFAAGGLPGELLDDPANPALDAGDDAQAPPIDIVGAPRPVDLPGVANNGVNASDLGAFELQGLTGVPQEPPVPLNVFAAGVEFQGDPKFDVLVDGEVIASGLTAGRTTGESSPAFLNDEVQRFEFDISADVPLAEVGIAFTNDLRAGPGQDRTLFVRAIEIDGHVFAPGTSVTSFDTNSPSAAVVQQAEDRGIVHANGSLEFDVTGEAPQLIVVQAAAQVFNGFPKFDVLVNGGTIAENVFNPLASFEPFTPGNLPDETDAFFFEIDPGIEIEEVAIDYSNDLNGAGGDRNLFIQSVAVGGELFLPGVDNFEFETQALNPDITTAAEERGVLFANGTLTLMLEEAEFV